MVAMYILCTHLLLHFYFPKSCQVPSLVGDTSPNPKLELAKTPMGNHEVPGGLPSNPPPFAYHGGAAYTAHESVKGLVKRRYGTVYRLIVRDDRPD